jgi:hypothetical protein
MNKTTKIFNNIGFYCSLKNDIFIPNNTIKSYQNLDHNSIGYYIPYLVRNLKDNLKWEIGVGEVIWTNGAIGVKRNELSSSSNNNKNVDFIGNENEFYLFVNNINFNSSFNNVVLKNDHFNIDNVTSIYLVDNSEKTIDGVLPRADDARNVVVDVKSLSSDHTVKIRLFNGEILGSTTDAIRLVSDGQSWYILNSFDTTINFGQLLNTDSFNMLSTPSGNDYSFQYKDGVNFEGSNLYWSSGDSNKLLLGADNEDNAHTIIPTSGSEPTIFNKDLQASDFIVYGSGQPYRNLYFAYDGRVGINIPSGSRPQTIFHVVNYSCSEILRLENRTTCQPAKLTVYHKPSLLNNGGTCSILNLAGRDINNNQKDYATIHSFVSDTTSGLGGIVLSVSSGGAPDKDPRTYQQAIISGDNNNITVGYDNNKKLRIANNGLVSLSGSSIDIAASTSAAIGNSTNNISFANGITLSQTSLNLGNGSITANGNITSNGNLISNGQITAHNGIILPSIAQSSLLTIDSSNRIVPISGISINNTANQIVLNNIEPNKFLSLDNNKNIVGLYDLDDYFLTEQDILWNKFPPRTASVCLKQITFDNPVPTEEFAIGDQIEIATNTGLIYRIINQIEFTNNLITGLILDQNVTTDTVNDVSVVSITKGGYLLIQKSTTGAVSDSTSNILSIRPLTDTIFNTAQKNINFTIYGKDTKPAFKVHASVGSVNQASGIYHRYATKDENISAIIINSIGSGISNSFSTANCEYNILNNLFESKVSSVGSNGKSSFYGTFDQNGNVKEWVESGSVEGIIQDQLAAGGSYNTNISDLRGIESLSPVSGYEDVGFRISSLSNISDTANVSNLGLLFRLISNPNNIADTGIIKLNGSNDNFINLGVVDNNYRISTYEITNNQYSLYLNSVATGISLPLVSGLYDPNMSGVLGGINQENNGITAEYFVKNNMGDKPVNFVSYINSLRFVNWLENGAPSTVNSSQLNNIINDGAYQLLFDGTNYQISTNKNRKYFLPSLNQWHKAAYFEYKDSVVVSGSPAITIGTDLPGVVATKITDSISTLNVENTVSENILANLTINGWLIVDKIIVRDGSVRSPLPSGFRDPENPDQDDDDEEEDITGQSDGPTPPPTGESKKNKYWNDPAFPSRRDGVYAEKEPPLIPDGTADMTTIDCDANPNNIPFWCEPDGKLKGPNFYP